MFADFQAFIRDQKATYALESASGEYDKLHSIFLSIFKLSAQYQKNPEAKERIEHEGRSLRLESLKLKHEALLKKKEYAGAFQTGEDYCDLLAENGDFDGAVEFYRSLFALYQSYTNEFFIYERSMSVNEERRMVVLHIQPFQDEQSFEKYLTYKKQNVWTKK